jgi:hypothetical protein
MSGQPARVLKSLAFEEAGNSVSTELKQMLEWSVRFEASKGSKTDKPERIRPKTQHK